MLKGDIRVLLCLTCGIECLGHIPERVCHMVHRRAEIAQCLRQCADIHFSDHTADRAGDVSKCGTETGQILVDPRDPNAQILKHFLHTLAEIREGMDRTVQRIGRRADGLGKLRQSTLQKRLVPGEDIFAHRLAKSRKGFTDRHQIIIEVCEIVPERG